jgi:hypothetical protein
LEEFVVVDWDSVTNSLSREVNAARDILRRLDEAGHLSPEDDDALPNLAI